MANGEISATNKAGMQDLYANNSAYNAVSAQIDKKIKDIETTFIGRIDSCSTQSGQGSGDVSATPMIQKVDANGHGLASPSYQKLAHYRVQGGIAALIIDPVAGDLGVFSCSKRDSSQLSKDSSQPTVPGSFRAFSPADATMVASIHTKTPEVYIELKQDKTITVIAPEGYTLNTNRDVNVTASGNITIRAGGNISLTAGGDVSIQGATINHN